MDKIKLLLKNLKSISSGFQSIIKAAFKDSEPEAIDLQVDQHVKHGVRADGSDIGEYSPYTVELKKLKGQSTDFVTLEDTGDYHNKMEFTKITDFGANIDSTDWKASKLVDDWGGDLTGLTEQNTEEYAKENFLTSLMEIIKNKLWVG